MPIVSNTLEQTVDATGGTHNVVRLVDQTGKVYTQSFFAPAGFAVAAKITTMIADMNVQLAQSEFENILRAP